MYNNYFSNFGSPPIPDDICKDLAMLCFGEEDLLRFFPYKYIGKQTWPCRKKGQMSMYDHYFSNFGRPPVPDDLCKDSAPKHPRF